MLREKMLEFVRCPDCLGRLAPIGEEELLCRNPECRRSYEVMHGRIPNLVEDESEVLDEKSWKGKLDAAGLKPREPEDHRPDPKRRRKKAEPKE
jgi:uncharacterized protein YbaR (Trm112 family)